MMQGTIEESGPARPTKGFSQPGRIRFVIRHGHTSQRAESTEMTEPVSGRFSLIYRSSTRVAGLTCWARQKPATPVRDGPVREYPR